MRHASAPVSVLPLVLDDLTTWLTRPIERREGGLMFDPISGAYQSTEFAISRFLVPYLNAGNGGQAQWAVFCDCDMLFREDVMKLLDFADPRYALLVVKHDHRPFEITKMDGQVQVTYPRKNWSSLILWNLHHRAHSRLTLHDLNHLPGRDLHRFCWLHDEEIGALPSRWNWLEGYDDASINPAVVHFTRGGPWFADYQDVAYADEWRRA